MVEGVGGEAALPAADDGVDDERRQLVRLQMAYGFEEAVARLAARVAFRVRLRPGADEAGEVRGAGAFFVAAWRRMRALSLRAARADAQAFMWRLPCSSRQSA